MAVSTIKSSGGDYTSLSSWEAAKQANLTGLGPEEAECYDFVDTTAVVIDGWTTTASDYIRVFAATEGKNDGRSRDVSGTGYQLATTGQVFANYENYFRLEDIDIKVTGPSSTVKIFTIPSAITAGTSDVRIYRTIFHDSRTSANTQSILTVANGWTVLFENVIAYGNYKVTQLEGGGRDITMNHCVFFTELQTFGLEIDNVVEINNTYIGGYVTRDLFTGWDPTGDYNMTSDTTAGTLFTNGIDSKAPGDQFVNASLGSSADFTVKTGADVIEAAPRLAGVLTDILGASRTDPTAIGAFEFAVVGGAFIPKIIMS